MKRKLPLIIAIVTLLIFSGLAIQGVRHNRQEIHRQNIELESKEFKLQKIESEFKSLNQQYKEELEKKDSDQQKLNEYEERIRQMEADYKALELSKAQEKAEQQRLANAAPKLTATASAAGGSCNTGNKYKDFIYYKESTCNPGAVNSIGCRGIGQACPGSKLPCGNDFACQDAWFSNYAIQRYGSWEAAYNFWLKNHWW